MKQKVVLILSVVIGLLAAFLSRQFLNAKERQLEQDRAELQSQFRTVQVVALKESMPAGTILKREDLKWRRFAESALREQAILKVENIDYMLDGRKLAVSVEKEKPLLWSDIVGGDPHARGLADKLPAKRRAISINVSGAASVSGMVQPNDRVDVLGTFSFPSKTNPAELELVTMTVLQNVTILATGRSMNRQAGNTGSQAGASYSTVTLEVTPHEAEMLVFAEQIKGRLTLSLRNPIDIYYEKTLPRVNFEYIQTQIEEMNRLRQEERPRAL